MKRKYTVCVSHPIPTPGITLLKKKGYDVHIFKKVGSLSKNEFIRMMKRCDVLLSLLTDTIDDDVLKANPHLLGVSNYAIGFNNIDVVAATKRGIIITNTPAPEVAYTVADFTVGLMLAAGRRIVEADMFTRAGKYHGWNPSAFIGVDLYGSTIGIVGMGHIGKEVARRLKGFGCSIVYYDYFGRIKDVEMQFGAQYIPLKKLLSISDYITLHVPLNESTHHLISTKEFSIMKKNAVIINTSRGPVIDEKALVRALEKGRIAGVAVDVYEKEPAIDVDYTDTLELKKQKNAVLTPHIASASVKARDKMSEMAARGVIAIIERDSSFKGLINPEVFKITRKI